MSKFNEKVESKTAVGGSFKKSLYHRSLSTQGFMQLQPFFYREIKPKERISGQAEVWSRLNTLVSPTFGDCDYHLSKFFVRYKDIWPCWDDYYNRSLHMFGDGSSGYVRSKPYFTENDLQKWLIQIGAVTVVSNPANIWDYETYGGGNNPVNYKWNDSFIALASLFQQLGYEFTHDLNSTKKYDALPLLAFGKIFIDHYWPRRYRNDASYKKIAAAFAYNGSSVNCGTTSVYNDAIKEIFTICTRVFYDNDGVYMAWDNPVGPEHAELGTIKVLDSTNANNPMNVVVDDGNSGLSLSPGSNYAPNMTPYLANNAVQGAVSAPGAITKNVLDMLYRISNMVKRYQLAGNSAAARFLATFGFSLGDTHESINLGEVFIPVRVGDVEANGDSQVVIGSDTYTSLLGNLAGKGVASKTMPINFNGDSHQGIYMVLLSIVPDSSIYQGMDRHNLNVDIEDVITPNNDSLGVRAISVQEVYNDQLGSYNNSHSNGVFGFLPFGYEDVVSRSILAGAFRQPSQGSAELAPYHMYRDLGQAVFLGQNPTSIGLNFLGSEDALQYNRVFYNMIATQQFKIRFRLKFDSYSWKKPLYKDYDWNMDGSNKSVSLDGNGVETN